MLKSCLLILLISGVLLVVMAYFGQGSIIYHPRSYSTNAPDLKKVKFIHYLSGGKKQVAFLYPETQDTTPEVLWWCFNGNGSTALAWVSLLEQGEFPPGHAFILMDYPGYGFSKGRPSPKSIYQSVRDLHSTLANRWGLSGSEINERSGTLGHSLGAAVALHTAAEFSMSKCIASAPFTSMKDMAALKMSWAKSLLRHHFDNRLSVEKIATRENAGTIHIIHGDRDGLVPYRMGEELHKLAGADHATLHRSESSGHNDVVYNERKLIYELLRGQ